MRSDDTHKNKISTGAIVGVITVVLVLVIFIVCLSLASAKTPEPIQDLGQLETALNDKTHVNCLVAHSDDGNFLVQANDGFAKVKVVLYGDDGNENMLTVDGTTYYWDDEGYAFVMSDRELMDEMLEEISAGFDDRELLEGYSISCESPSKNDFAVPSLDFIDVSDM
ncbi:MAG: hypothetical protein ACK5MU_03030 [Candidatus Saccharimonadales bacterium]